MNIHRFEGTTRPLTITSSRRRFVGSLVASFSLVALPVPRARAKKHNKQTRKRRDAPAFTAVTRTVRQPRTQTFSNPDPITIPSVGQASPYPSLIDVAGFTNGRILDINLTLHGFSHDFPSDVDILLAAAHVPGQNALVLSDVGGITGVTDLTLTLDDQAPTELPPGLASGIFRPTNLQGTFVDEFPAPAPTPRGGAQLSAFKDSNPNGSWQLFVVDGISGDGGSIAGGWSLEITAEVDVQVEEQISVPGTKHKKHKKRGRR